MQISNDAPPALYLQAWIGLGIVITYYAAVLCAFRLRGGRATIVTRYEPPPDISPAVAALLWESGHYERAFAAALVSLAAKGYLELGQHRDRFVFKKLRQPDETLTHEEYETLIHLFLPSEHSYAFDSVEYQGLCESYSAFKEALKEAAESSLMSAHANFWWIGVVASLIAIAPIAGTIATLKSDLSWASVGYLGIWILLGGSCLVAAVRVWPATLHKLTSYIPLDDRPSRPLNASDAFPLILSASALLGLMFLSVLTSTRFAVLIAATVLINAIFRRALESPTRAGYEALTGLRNFREFLSSADAGRLNLENRAGATPRVLEKYSAYAIALRVEHAWGEELVENFVELLELDQAYNRR